jgi:hypothetical protein
VCFVLDSCFSFESEEYFDVCVWFEILGRFVCVRVWNAV